MAAPDGPALVMLAGPSGAGKSTFYRAFLERHQLPFVNADQFAGDLGLDAYEAAAIADAVRARMVEERISFISETVFSDPAGAKLDFLLSAVEAGFEVTLIYIGIASPQLSGVRILSRVRAGGHDVPEEKLEPRYERSLANLRRAVRHLPRVMVFDNSKYRNPFRFVVEYQAGNVVRRGVGPAPVWTRAILDP